MSLRKRLVYTVFAVFGCAGILFMLLTDYVVIGGGEKIEHELVQINLDRVKDALVAEEKAVSSRCRDWAGWNETRDYLLGKNPGFAINNLTDYSLRTVKLDFMALYDLEGRLVRAKAVNPVTGYDKPMEPESLAAIRSYQGLFTHSGPEHAKRGWIRIPGGAALVSSWPVTNNEFKLPISGTLVAGRFWTLGHMRQIANKLKLRIALLPVDINKQGVDGDGVESDADRIEVMDANTIEGKAAINGIDGEPVLTLRLDMPRDVMHYMRMAVNSLMLLMALVGAGILLVVLVWVDRLVIQPVEGMTKATVEITHSRDRALRLPDQKGGELATLGTAINGMLCSLAEAEEERIQAESKAQTSLRVQSLNVMAGSIAHKFNNLLQGIVGNLEISLQQVPPGEEVRQDLEMAKDTTERAIDLSHLMSTYVGEGPQRQAVFDPLVTFREVLDPYAEMSAAGVETIVEIADHLPPVLGNEGQLRDMCHALISNAMEAMDDGQGRLRIQVEVMDCDQATFAGCCFDEGQTPGRYISLVVADSGSGMDEDTQQKLFDPFFTTRVIGRGLGMSTVLGVVRSHSGAIRVETAPGSGTVIQVLIPCHETRGAVAAVEGE